ncbi:hypothetical protein HaLaN_02129 [Haematococcus lacustris]|uniref:Secreted protein n=1 Tax=Haematococcus lacustris TaxID=44745 RepID=A0A699YWB9_HAELA|nr:hypothetical protein HaLaN_02129 [Haematococcus lacustris]
MSKSGCKVLLALAVTATEPSGPITGGRAWDRKAGLRPLHCSHQGWRGRLQAVSYLAIKRGKVGIKACNRTNAVEAVIVQAACSNALVWLKPNTI